MMDDETRLLIDVARLDRDGEDYSGAVARSLLKRV